MCSYNVRLIDTFSKFVGGGGCYCERMLEVRMKKQAVAGTVPYEAEASLVCWLSWDIWEVLVASHEA